MLAGIAFILGSLCDMFDGRYSRMSGKGTPFGAFLDSTLDRIEEGVVLAAVAWWFAEQGDEVAVGATVLDRGRLLHGLLHARPRRGARRGVQGRDCVARGPGSHPLGRPGVRGRASIVPGFDLLEPAIYAMAALTIFTTFQRVFHVRKQLAARCNRSRCTARVLY